MKIKKPVIEKMFVCSTSHISENDSKLLNVANNNSLLSVYEYEYGWRVYVGNSLKEKGFKKGVLNSGYSKEFYNLLKITTDLKCEWLLLDQADNEYPELKTFDW